MRVVGETRFLNYCVEKMTLHSIILVGNRTIFSDFALIRLKCC